MAKKLVVGLIVITCLLTIFLAFRGGVGSPSATKPAGIGKSVGIIRIEGEIAGAYSSGGLGADSMLDSVTNALIQARKRDDIVAVVIRIDSPGGTVAASQEITEEVDRLRKTGKPVIASMGDIAASGGYWVATSCDTIVANPATMTGSIGVIMETTNYQGLMQKLGVTDEVIKSGKYKDIGSSTRQMTEEERQLLQGMVTDTYQQFLDQIKKGRKGKIDESKLTSIADGRIFTGRQALKLGLVDKLGSFQDTINLAGKQAGLEGSINTEELVNPSPFSMMMNLFSMATGFQNRMVNASY
ncbi:MAG: signal peptide peptidase SppA [Chitinophagales bacterium]